MAILPQTITSRPMMQAALPALQLIHRAVLVVVDQRPADVVGTGLGVDIGHDLAQGLHGRAGVFLGGSWAG